MAVFQLLICFTAFLFLNVLADPAFPKFPNDYSGKGTIEKSIMNVSFSFVSSESLKSIKFEFQYLGRKDTFYALENMGAYGTDVRLRNEAGHTECTILEGTAKKPIKYKSIFTQFNNIKYVGREQINGTDMYIWQFYFMFKKIYLGYFITYENENGPAPYRIYVPGAVTIIFEDYSSTPPPQSAFTYDTKGCKRNEVSHVFQNFLGTLLK